MQWIFVIKKSWFIPFYFISLPPSLPFLTSPFFTSLGVSIPIFYFLILYGSFSLCCVVWLSAWIFVVLLPKKQKKIAQPHFSPFDSLSHHFGEKQEKILLICIQILSFSFVPYLSPLPCPVLSFSSLQNCFLFVTLKFNLKNTFLQLFFLSCDG